MEHIEIRKVKLSDLKQLVELSRRTFLETFSDTNSEENMNKYLEEELSEEKITSQLTDENSIFYFALVDEKAIGYLKLNFSHSQTEIKDENAVEIERIYVLRDFLGKQVGQVLYEKAIQTARERNAGYVWLGVWEENERAIKFYKKNGFIQFDKHIFKLGEDEQTDIMMKLQLNPA